MAADVTLVPLPFTLPHPIHLPRRYLFCLSLSHGCFFYCPNSRSEFALSRSGVPLQASLSPCFRSDVDLCESEDPQQSQHVGCLSSVDKVYKLRSISCLYSLGFQQFRSECSLARSKGSVLSSAYSCDWIVGVDATKVLVSVMFRWLLMFVEMAIRVLCRLGFCAEIGTDGASMRVRRFLGGSGYGYGSGGRSDECYLGGSGGDYEVCGFHQDWRRSFSPESFRLGMFSANED